MLGVAKGLYSSFFFLILEKDKRELETSFTGFKCIKITFTFYAFVVVLGVFFLFLARNFYFNFFLTPGYERVSY